MVGFKVSGFRKGCKSVCIGLFLASKGGQLQVEQRMTRQRPLRGEAKVQRPEAA